jgi:hypothetical protein
MCNWVTPCPIFLKKLLLACSVGKDKRTLGTETPHILMSPSADPVAKYSSCGSIAIHLTAFSCAVNLCRIAFDLTSIRQTSPRFPAEISTWCWGANTKLLDPWSWQVNATTKAFPWGRIESQMQTFLLSELWPAVANKLHDPKKTKSLMPLLWHWRVKKGLVAFVLSPTWNKLRFPSESATPNLFPCWENLTLVTLA